MQSLKIVLVRIGAAVTYGLIHDAAGQTARFSANVQGAVTGGAASAASNAASTAAS
jgi:hypothetical protein